MNNDKPANIAFIDEARGGRGDSDQVDDDDITILEEEDEEFDAPPSRAKSSGSAKKGVPKWIFAVGGGIILIALIGGGLMVYSMMNRMSASDEIMPVPPQPISQPEIQSQQGEYGAPQPSSSVLGQEVPVGPGAAMPSAQPAQPTMDAQPPVSRPDAVEVRPLAPTQVPAAAQPPVTQQGMGSANNAMMEEQLNKVIAGLAALNKRLDEEAARRGKLETEFAALKGRIGDTSKKAPAVVQQPKPVTTPAPRAVQSAQSKPVRSAQPAPAQPVHQGDAGVKLSQQTEGVVVAPVVPERVQGWTISSIIGSRAWLIKRNSDGTETELSVAPGERIEGKLVTSVDGASKSVTLEGGQKIGVGK